MNDTSIAHLMIEKYTVVRWPEIRRWMTMGGESDPMPDFLDRLGAADLYAFSSGPEHGTFFAVTTEEQQRLLVLLKVHPLRVFTRVELEAALQGRGYLSSELAPLSLLQLIRMLAQPPAPMLN